MQEPAQIELVAFVASTCGDFHHDGLGHRQRPILGDQIGDTPVDIAARRTVELHPRRGIDEDHASSDGGRSSGTEPMACAPRIASASSRDIG